MAKSKKAAAPRQKRDRNSKPYEDKQKMVSLLNFDTEASFDKWRASSLVKALWEILVHKFLEDESASTPGKKVADVQNLCNWIREGEKNGGRRFLRSRDAPEHKSELDWHGWLTFWLVEENRTDRQGCFFNMRIDRNAMLKNAYHFVVWAKRQRARAHRGQESQSLQIFGYTVTASTQPIAIRCIDIFGAVECRRCRL